MNRYVPAVVIPKKSSQPNGANGLARREDMIAAAAEAAARALNIGATSGPVSVLFIADGSGSTGQGDAQRYVDLDRPELGMAACKRFEALQQVYESLRRHPAVGCRISCVVFSDHASLSPNPHYAGGNTNLEGAIRLAAGNVYDQALGVDRKVLLVTDGLPDDLDIVGQNQYEAPRSFAAAQTWAQQHPDVGINVLYVGPDATHDTHTATAGHAVLKKIARLTGGTFEAASLSDPAGLLNAAAGLLQLTAGR